MKYFSINFRFKTVILILILLIAGILRFWKITEVPPALFVDEVSNGYNAYSILKTGRDEYGNFLPLTFRSFGDYNPALSVYLLVPSITIFGLNEFAVRFPSALFGTLTVLLTYLLVRELFKSNARGPVTTFPPVSAQPSQTSKFSKLSQSVGLCAVGSPSSRATPRFSNWWKLEIYNSETIALLAALFLAIAPWHLQFSRYDHEANFMVFFSLLGLVLLLYSSKKFLLLNLSAISFGLALNSYHGAKIWIPIFVILAAYFFRDNILKFKKSLILPFLILAVFTLPFVLNFQESLIRSRSVGIFGKTDRPFETFISNYLSHYSPNFLFIQGDLSGRHSVIGMGQLYVFELPLVILGIVGLITIKSRASRFLLAWFMLAPIGASISEPAPHALRAITFIPIFSILASLGFFAIIFWRISTIYKKIIFVLIGAIAFYNFVTYLHLYYKHEPKLKSKDWSEGYKEMVNFVSPIKDNYETAAITNFYGHPYIHVLFYSQYDPKLYQWQSENKQKFDKYEFFGESWDKKTNGKVLMVRPFWQISNPTPKYIKFIYAKNGELVFRISEE